MNKVISDYKIVPVHGGGICLMGIVDGKRTQTSNIVRVRPGYVATTSGSIYELKGQAFGMWAMQLQLKRPIEYKKLVENKII